MAINCPLVSCLRPFSLSFHPFLASEVSTLKLPQKPLGLPQTRSKQLFLEASAITYCWHTKSEANGRKPPHTWSPGKHLAAILLSFISSQEVLFRCSVSNWKYLKLIQRAWIFFLFYFTIESPFSYNLSYNLLALCRFYSQWGKTDLDIHKGECLAT